MEKQLEVQFKKYEKLQSECKTLMISSMDDKGDPHVSYSPFVIYEGNFYIFISKIAAHFQYLENNKFISVMIIADEATSPILFARERIRYKCTPEYVGNVDKEHIFDKFIENHGEQMIKVLRGIDLSLFKLTPMEGRYIAGFGQAFEIDPIEGTFIQIDPSKMNH
ncbi:HugZ family protein [Gottfriedia acidiceleris]|uniref:HugZ family pyridoxamine 5'-phosphate oxidase n=1 Tax=Gottfriedia acidiceleris TaxID=371036 RepID=UPI00101D1D78|nr:pyridoxamine 5'-phosphate oxidase family protein [Gottfriedia acidiceleris]